MLLIPGGLWSRPKSALSHCELPNSTHILNPVHNRDSQPVRPLDRRCYALSSAFQRKMVFGELWTTGLSNIEQQLL